MSQDKIITDEWQDIRDKEWDEYLSKRRPNTPEDWQNRLTGLAISGGGIRSAAFSLGILQKLAAEKLLGLFDYLSTVSGGGYTGGSISYYLNNSDFDKKDPPYDLEDNFPYGDPEHTWHSPAPELDFLRSHGNYLVPGNEINMRSFVGVVLRAVLLNLIIWIPVLMLMMGVAQRLIITGSSGSCSFVVFGMKFSIPWMTDPLALVGLGLFVLTFIIGSFLLKKMKSFNDPNDKSAAVCRKARTINWSFFFFGAWLFACRVIAVNPTLPKVSADQAKTWLEGLKNGFENISGFWLTEVPLIFKLFELGVLTLAALYVLSILYYSISTFFQKDKTEYLRRRKHAVFYGILLKYLLLFSVIALVPYISRFATTIGGVGTLCAGVAMGLWKLYQKGKEWISINVLAPIASLLVLYGLLITAYSYSSGLETLPYQWSLYCMSFVAIGLGYIVNLNHISVGRYYRDRLMEAFQPDEELIRDNENGPAKGANSFSISKLAPADPKKPKTPYHLINTTAVLIDSSQKKIKKRGGDSFIFSPFYVGSHATGWVKTDRFYGNEFTLATAVAISAAAVNPHTGVAGSGLTRNPAVSFLMALLNIRLGYWAPNPKRAEFCPRMNHFWAGWYEVAPYAGYNEESTFVQLSDGGHFDNLGLYELFRRRVRFILVLDGGADKDFQFSDLQNALHRAEQDFKVHIRFNGKIGDMIPQKQDQYKFPEGLKLADKGYISGRFNYGPEDDNEEGWIFFVKTTLIEDMSMRVLGYKGANPDFPDETTADQFFNEDQFDAYRLLGNKIAEQLIDDQAFSKELKEYFEGKQT